MGGQIFNEQHEQPTIKIKGGYSESSGIIKFNTISQVDDLNHRTRIIIGNTIYEIFTDCFDDYNQYTYRYIVPGKRIDTEFCKAILSEVFEQDIQSVMGCNFSWVTLFKKYIFPAIQEQPYNIVLDLIWYICNWLNDNVNGPIKAIFTIFNNLFEKENVGYRFVDGEIIRITDQVEIDEIEQACNCKFDSCKAQIKNAVVLLSDRDNKDYKDSIKDSISAVETICKIIICDDKATLGQALKKLKSNGVEIHPALEQAFSSFYGYACDVGGIRHGEDAIESNVTYDEAKFMLVVCSAFINYLISIYKD